MTVEELTKSANLSVEKRAALNVLITQNQLSERLNEVLKPFEISVEQFNVLRILRGQKKPANMCIIQERMIAKKSNTTRLVDKLLLKKLVSREVCSENRRKIEVTITATGLEFLNEIDPKIEAYEKSIGSNMTTAELIQLSELLQKYRAQ